MPAINRAAIGIFGGTFDPVHKGHLAAVDALTEHLRLTRVNWVLSARPPHKDRITAGIQDRYAMLELALSEHNALHESGSSAFTEYVADATEIERAQRSYTIDTVETFSEQYPGAQLCLIIGSDSLHQLHTWRRYEALLDQVHWVVMNRPGYALQAPSELANRVVRTAAELMSKPGQFLMFEESEFAISSTQLRAELAKRNGYDADLVKQFLSSAVINYIRAKHLYKIGNMNPEKIKDQVVDSLENVKAQDIRVIDISDISDFADYMVVASGTSDTHVKALAREASTSLRQQGVKPLNEDGADIGEWVLVDFGDVVLHVMRPEVRAYYDLEKLWDEDVRTMLKTHRESQED